MESKFCFVFLLVFCTGVQSASLLEKSYDYLMNLGKNLTPSFLSILECVGNEEPWGCAREKAGKMLDGWGEDVEKERRMWAEEADAEVRTSGRSLAEMPSKIGGEILDSMGSLANVIERGMARAYERKKHDSGGIDSITISTGGGDKKKMKKKPKPPKIHLVHPMIIRKAHKEEKGRSFGNGVQSWVIGERSLPETVNSTPTVEDSLDDSLPDFSVSTPVEGRGMFSYMWDMGKETLDSLADQVLEEEEKDNGIKDKSSVEEQRGKKKKKKKAILKLLVLGAVIKAKIATLLQILTYKLQVKFFIITVLTFIINIIRLWIEFKNSNTTTTTISPPKEWRSQNYATEILTDGHQSDPKHSNIIYYEHAQHQHHYDHEEEEPSHGWGPWSRSIFPTDDTEIEVTDDASPYRAQEKAPLVYSRPYHTRV